MTALAGTATTSSSAAGGDLDVAVHVGQQREIGIGQLDAHPRRAGFFHQVRIDHRDRAVKMRPGCARVVTVTA